MGRVYLPRHGCEAAGLIGVASSGSSAGDQRRRRVVRRVSPVKRARQAWLADTAPNPNNASTVKTWLAGMPQFCRWLIAERDLDEAPTEGIADAGIGADSQHEVPGQPG
jgi:hypothetical protein